jgi:hypothetical protein
MLKLTTDVYHRERDTRERERKRKRERERASDWMAI